MTPDLNERIFEKDGCPIHYWVSRVTGGPWLFFLHGAGADHRMFEPQFPVVREKFNIIAWDARGHGLSRPMGNEYSFKILLDDLFAIMDREACEKATLIGQSAGGNLAQEAVFYHPERVESLVLIDCTWNRQKLSRSERFLLKISPGILSLYPWKLLVNQSAAMSSIKPEVRGYLRETFCQIDKKDFIKILTATMDCLHSEVEYQIKQKMLLVCGDLDHTGNIRRIAPVWASKELDCRFAVIGNAGHMANMDHPEEFNRLLLEFLGV